MNILWQSTCIIILVALLFTNQLFAQDTSERAAYEYAIDLYGATSVRTAAREWMLRRANPDVAPALIRSLRYFPEDSSQTLHVLKQLTGQELGKRWFDWFVWMQANPLPSLAGNEIFLAKIFSRIDPQFSLFLYPHVETRIWLDEITWGGVRKDGIPALTSPTLIPADEATYLGDDELVFGVSINGDIRAYPYRIMDWHEMLNDTIGGVPVSLAYCTLCGSGILYQTQAYPHESFVFGSSGLLYRSNKLMYDQQTHSLWNQFSGEPVVGPLADSGITLKALPLVTSSWKQWRSRHPTTSVLALETGYQRDYTPGAAYGAYFASDELMFPAHVEDRSLPDKAKVFGLRISGIQKAWPLSLFRNQPIVHDQIGIMHVVLIGDAQTSSVRAYRAGNHQFTLTEDQRLLSNRQEWQMTEDELIGPNHERLSRLPGHLAYWFAWSGYFPHSLASSPATDATGLQ